MFLPVLNKRCLLSAAWRCLLWLVPGMVGLVGCTDLPIVPHTQDSQMLSDKLVQAYANTDAFVDASSNTPTTNTSNASGNVSSNALNNTLARTITAQNAMHPGLSGYYPIVTGADALAARSILTDLAVMGIDVQYYTWHNDQAGQLLFKKLWQAAERGVVIRFLLDDFNRSDELDRTLIRFAAHPNIAVRLINPLVHRSIPALNYLTDFSRINRRMHNKSMTFDQQISIIGGRNIGNEYLSNSKSSQFADLDMMLIGSVIDDINTGFESYWSSSSSYDVQTIVADKRHKTEPSVDESATANAAFLSQLNKITIDGLSAKEADTLELYQQAIAEATLDTELLNKTVPFRWASMQLLYDDVNKLTKDAESNTYLVHQLQTLLGRPKDKITLISSYFVPTQAGVTVLTSLAKQGIDVNILTNSFDANDVAAVHVGYAKWRKPLLQAGVNIYELKATTNAQTSVAINRQHQSATSLHAKTFAVDDHHVFIGSYNIDPRSANLNTEVGVLINDDELARQLHDTLDDSLLSQAYKVTLSNTGDLQWRTREDDGSTVVYDNEPNMSVKDRIIHAALSGLPIDWLL